MPMWDWIHLAWLCSALFLFNSPPWNRPFDRLGAAIGWAFAARVARCDDCGLHWRAHIRGVLNMLICPPQALRPYMERAALHDRYCDSCHVSARWWAS